MRRQIPSQWQPRTKIPSCFVPSWPPTAPKPHAGALHADNGFNKDCVQNLAEAALRLLRRTNHLSQASRENIRAAIILSFAPTYGFQAAASVPPLRATRISRLPTEFAAEISPSRSIRSIKSAARL